MQCLRCGKEIDDREVFCPDCLKNMERHPVKPNTVVTIPERSVRNRNTPPRRPQKPEDNTEALRRTIMQLRLWVCMLMAALMLCVAYISWQELSRDEGLPIGENYTSYIDFSGGGR